MEIQNTSIRIFEYEGQVIEFDISSKNVMVNATEMAKIFETDPSQFLRNDKTEEFIVAALSSAKTQNSEASKAHYSTLAGVLTREDLLKINQRHGTWMHRILALKFAAWLDPYFEVWVYSTIESLQYGELRRVIEEKAGKTAAKEAPRVKKLQQEIDKAQVVVDSAKQRIQVTSAADQLIVNEQEGNIKKWQREIRAVERAVTNDFHAVVQYTLFDEEVAA